MTQRNFTVLIVSTFLGFLIISQVKAFSNANETLARESSDGIFQQLKILKTKNDSLRDEVRKLEQNLSNLSNREMALETVKKEIEEFSKLDGGSGIFGEGIVITFDKNISVESITDLINEMLNSGAQAIAVNGLRYTNQSAGFDLLPNGQIFYSGQILSTPLVFTVIGDIDKIDAVINAPRGILWRIKEINSGLTTQVEAKLVIQINSTSQNGLFVDQQEP